MARKAGRRSKKDREAIDAAARVFKEFHGWDAENVTEEETPDMSTLVELGDALGVLYRSDKFNGRRRRYIHEFGRAKPRLFGTADGKALVIFGGKLDIKPEGITG